MFDVILQPAVEVNGFFVDEDKRAREINFPDDIRLACNINDHEIVAGDGA